MFITFLLLNNVSRKTQNFQSCPNGTIRTNLHVNLAGNESFLTSIGKKRNILCFTTELQFISLSALKKS